MGGGGEGFLGMIRRLGHIVKIIVGMWQHEYVSAIPQIQMDIMKSK